MVPDAVLLWVIEPALACPKVTLGILTPGDSPSCKRKDEHNGKEFNYRTEAPSLLGIAVLPRSERDANTIERKSKLHGNMSLQSLYYSFKPLA